jgi:UDP-N-acetylmuramoyl-tripeptide--D-alanyl-D-alanine ligase
MTNLFSVLIFFILLPLFLMRWLRWLAFVQQKEYRIDRMLSFLQSPAGRSELVRIFPKRKDFSRIGLKRPARTTRVLVVAIVSVLIFLVIVAGTWWSIFSVVLMYLLLPCVMIVACLPSAIVAEMLTHSMLKKAQQKFAVHKPKIIGIGGSYGKTSTKHLLAHVLSQKFSVFVTPKSHNTKYSIAKSIVDGFSDQQVALIEYGAYTISEIAYLTTWFPPDMAIETGFTLQHLGLFGSQQNSLLAESELPAAVPEDGLVFCNAADAGAVEICHIGTKGKKTRVFNYSGEDTVVELENPQLNERGELSFVWQKKLVQTKLVGRQYLVNVQGVIAAACAMGLDAAEIFQGLQSFVPSSAYVLTRQLQTGAIFIDDGGTSNPKGFASAIDLAKELTRSQNILFCSGIVDLGSESRQVHVDLATHAKSVFQTVVYLGSDGQKEFLEVFGKSLLTTSEEVDALLATINANSLLLIEGRMPKWLTARLQ